MHLTNYNDRLYDRDRTVNELKLLGVLRHISPPAGHSTQPPHSPFVLPLTRNSVAKTKTPYSFALVPMSRGFQFLPTFMAVSSLMYGVCCPV